MEQMDICYTTARVSIRSAYLCPNANGLARLRERNRWSPGYTEILFSLRLDFNHCLPLFGMFICLNLRCMEVMDKI